MIPVPFFNNKSCGSQPHKETDSNNIIYAFDFLSEMFNVTKFCYIKQAKIGVLPLVSFISYHLCHPFQEKYFHSHDAYNSIFFSMVIKL